MDYYEKTMPTCYIKVLGTRYAVYVGVSPEQDKFLETCDGYCDKTAKRIVVIDKPENNEFADWDVYSKQCVRHEIIHAFMHESGLDGNCKFDVAGQEHPEHLVSWIAIQFPKILTAFQEASAL